MGEGRGAGGESWHQRCRLHSMKTGPRQDHDMTSWRKHIPRNKDNTFSVTPPLRIVATQTHTHSKCRSHTHTHTHIHKNTPNFQSSWHVRSTKGGKLDLDYAFSQTLPPRMVATPIYKHTHSTYRSQINTHTRTHAHTYMSWPHRPTDTQTHLTPQSSSRIRRNRGAPYKVLQYRIARENAHKDTWCHSAVDRDSLRAIVTNINPSHTHKTHDDTRER